MMENDWSSEVSYAKIQSGGIRVVRQNQRIRRLKSRTSFCVINLTSP